MPPVQKTFDLVPTTLARTPTHQRPMTSTQVKKAYRNLNRGPKISRAEQRRRDTEELQRQKREFEREQAAVKSKAAREKKALKAREEKDKRKRDGLPEPRKGVRPSQARISCFVRREGTRKRKWEVYKNEMDESEDTMEEDEPKPATGDSHKQLADEYGGDDFADFDLPDLWKRLEETHPSHTVGVKKEGGSQRPCSSQTMAVGESKSSRLTDEEQYLDDSQALAEMATTQLLTEAAQSFGQNRQPYVATENKEKHHLTPGLKPISNATMQESQNAETRKFSAPGKRRLQETTGNRLPPLKPSSMVKGSKVNALLSSLRPKQHRSAQTALKHPKSLKIDLHHQRMSSPSLLTKPLSHHLGSSTQAFLEAHADVFFPSDSQQTRDLLVDANDADLPSNTQVLKEISSNALQKELSFAAELICTQDLMSSQEIQEMETPCPQAQGEASEIWSTTQQLQLEELDWTRDLDLSPQDIEEIESLCRLPSPLAAAPISAAQPLKNSTVKGDIAVPASGTVVKPVPTAIEPYARQTKDANSSKYSSNPHSGNTQISATSRTALTSLPDVLKPARKPFFTVNDLPSAPIPPKTVIDEAEGAQQTKRCRFFIEKEDDLMQAAIEKSLAPSQQVVPTPCHDSGSLTGERPETTNRAAAGSAVSKDPSGKMEGGRPWESATLDATNFGDWESDFSDMGFEHGDLQQYVQRLFDEDAWDVL